MNSVSPITFKSIESYQGNSQVIRNVLHDDPICHRLHIYASHKLAQICDDPECHRLYNHASYKLAQLCPDKESTNWKIIIPDSLVGVVIKWFHPVIIHPGAWHMMYDTITAHLYTQSFAISLTTSAKLVISVKESTVMSLN